MNPLDNLSNSVRRIQDRERGIKDIRVLNYEIVKPKLQKQKNIILDVLKSSKTPLTSDEISDRCILTKYQVRPVLSKLYEDGVIKDFSKNKINGYWRYLWVLV